MDDARLMRFSHSYKVIPIRTALDWSAWNVQNDPATEQISAPGSGGDAAQGFAKAVEMCNNNGHCHQKAFGAVTPIIDVLKLIPGAKPELIESSCCGMAGSFGYEASHYAVSMQMAELSLLPAVRQQLDAIVVADGTSCRHQIRDGAQREAIHVAVLLARQLQC